MNDKKQSSNWYIAATHWLTSSFTSGAIQFVFWLIFTNIVSSMPAIPDIILRAVVFVAAVWCGVWYSARYINRKYQMSNPNSVVMLSSTYTLLSLLAVLVLIISSGRVVQTGILVVVIYVLAIGLTFYVSSKKYLG